MPGNNGQLDLEVPKFGFQIVRFSGSCTGQFTSGGLVLWRRVIGVTASWGHPCIVSFKCENDSSKNMPVKIQNFDSTKSTIMQRAKSIQEERKTVPKREPKFRVILTAAKTYSPFTALLVNIVLTKTKKKKGNRSG
jgi:hypothetical protein